MSIPLIGDLDGRHVASSWGEKAGSASSIAGAVIPIADTNDPSLPLVYCWRSTFAVGDVTLSGAFPGDSPPEGSRLCIAEQTDLTENDFYIYSSTGAWVRDESITLKSGMIVSLHSEQFLAQLVTVGPVRGSSDIVFVVLTALQMHGVAGFLSMLIESDNQSVVTDITFPSSTSIRYGLSIRSALAVYEDQGMTAVTIPAAGTTWPFQCATVRVAAENLTMTTAPWSAAVAAEHGGKYAITARYYDASNGAWPAATQLILGVYVNAVLIEELDDVIIGPTQLFRMSGAYLLDLADGDVVTIEVRQTGGASQGTVGGGRSYVSIHRLPG
jgi:hypothetical protein